MCCFDFFQEPLVDTEVAINQTKEKGNKEKKNKKKKKRKRNRKEHVKIQKDETTKSTEDDNVEVE